MRRWATVVAAREGSHLLFGRGRGIVPMPCAVLSHSSHVKDSCARPGYHQNRSNPTEQSRCATRVECIPITAEKGRAWPHGLAECTPKTAQRERKWPDRTARRSFCKLRSSRIPPPPPPPNTHTGREREREREGGGVGYAVRVCAAVPL